MSISYPARFLVLLLVGAFPHPALDQQQHDITGTSPTKVVRVLDGRTVVLLMEGKETVVRLIGVDARMKSSGATSCLNSLIAGKDIFLEMEPDLAIDSEGHAMAYIYRSSDRLFVNSEIIRQGCCFADTDRPFKYARELRAEREAEKAGRGIWASSESVTSNSDNRRRAFYRIGDQVTLYSKDKSDIVVSGTLSAMEEGMKATAAHDRYGIRELVDSRQLFEAGSGTKGLVLEFAYFNPQQTPQFSREPSFVYTLKGHEMAQTLLKLRFLEGKFTGKIGWVTDEFVVGK